jgi:pumilio family protein 6
MSTKSYNNKRSAPGASGPGGKSGYQGKSGHKGGNGASYGKPQRDFRPTKPQPGSLKGKQPQKEETAVRRKRPVTQGGGSEEEAEDEDEGDDDEMDVDQPEGAEGVEGATGENGEPAEKRPKLSKAEKAALHAAQPHRTSLLPSHPLLHGTLLPLWEKARRADLGKEERKVAVKELYESAKGRIAEISRGHKGGRVLQTVRSMILPGKAKLRLRSSSTEARRSDWALRWSCNRNGGT